MHCVWRGDGGASLDVARGFCAAVLAWGTGVVAYLVLMLCIPPKTRQAE